MTRNNRQGEKAREYPLGVAIRRKLAVPMVVLLLLGGAAYVFGRGYIEGAATAVADQAHGRGRVFLLGCGYWPRTAFEKRRDELLWQKYHVAFDAIGGIAPSRFALQFQVANNVVTLAVLRVKHGPRCIKRVEEQARADVAASSGPTMQ